MFNFFKNNDLDSKEIIWGGIFGIIAIVAAVIEMFLGGFTAEAIVSSIKDVFGTAVVVVLMISFIKQNIKKEKPFDLTVELNKAIKTWYEKNDNMIVLKSEYNRKSRESTSDDCFGLGLRTDVSGFYQHELISNASGLFLRMPTLAAENYREKDVDIEFSLNKGTFFEGVVLDEQSLKNAFSKLNKEFVGYIEGKFSSDKVRSSGKDRSIIVRIKNGVNNKDDIALVVDVINTMYMAYLVSANVNAAKL